MKVRDAMHRGVDWFGPATSIVEIAAAMRDGDIGAVPIGENDRLVGMVTDRDIVIKGVAEGRDISALTARDVMTEGIIYCRDSEELDDALRIMEQRQVRRLPVIDDGKRMVGILSLGDVSHAAPAQMTGELASAVSAHHA